MGGTIYVNNQPISVLTPEGRLLPGDNNQWQPEYHLKDHLGNTRAVVAGTLLPGTADVIQTTAYYPFGLVMLQNNTNTLLPNTHTNRYLYNGKELQTEGSESVELGWLDYGARMYDAQLGRWHTVDPLAEKYYEFGPYHYVRNKPINLIDPTGMSDQDPNGSPEENKKLKREAEARKKEQEEWEKWRRENLLKDAAYNAIDEFDYQRRVNDAVQRPHGGGDRNAWVKSVETGVKTSLFMVTNTTLKLMSADGARDFLLAQAEMNKERASYFSRISYALGLLVVKKDWRLGTVISTIGFVGGEIYGEYANRFTNLDALIRSVHSDGVYLKTVSSTVFSIHHTLSYTTIEMYTYDGEKIGELGY